MNPDRTAALVRRWARFYTRGLPAPVAERRIAELDADLHDHLAYERAARTGGTRIALGLLSRMIRGLPADLSWRGQHLQDRFPTVEEAMKKQKNAYRSAVGVALAAALILLWGMGAVGVIGVEGDRADLMYFGVLAVGVAGAFVARFRPAGMARALVATAAAQALVTAIALLAGKHESPATSIVELVGLNGFFAALFLGSAWLFRRAEPKQPPVLR
ncbi:hypothetical protein [Amycolatopsis sp. YIM 10]|uniref:hypothetical protein n=1 Tax=Amycolatopsis sp. YIM 10 TaxID=2653857 RepID=UPI0012906318|nr:hypothetical protein [Amycolatopsis sp. YIM 10]QFU88270.1 hypothetical protein YIM_15425 [Amycolatopsis sp. YIM 10]